MSLLFLGRNKSNLPPPPSLTPNVTYWLDFTTASGRTLTGGRISQITCQKSGTTFVEESGSGPVWAASGDGGRGIATFSGAQYLRSSLAASSWSFLHTGVNHIFVRGQIGAATGGTSVATRFGVLLATSITGGQIGAYLRLARTDTTPNRLEHGILNSSSVIFNFSGNNSVDTSAIGIYSAQLAPSASPASARSVLGINGTLHQNNAGSSAVSASAPTNTLHLGACATTTTPQQYLVGGLSQIVIAGASATEADLKAIYDYLSL